MPADMSQRIPDLHPGPMPPRASAKSSRKSLPREVAAPDRAVDEVDTRYLETLIGYNARRAALSVIGLFLQRMAVYGLKPVDFSVLSLITHNPGITSAQLCSALSILPPNLVGIINALARRGLIGRQPHPRDGRAMGLHLTDAGHALMVEAEQTASDLEIEATGRLSAAERQTLIRLLRKVYLPP
jgi:DNA-binding MarR family transcriptional regulator